MTKIHFRLFALALLAILTLGQSHTAVAQTNLLNNPSFEEPYVNGAAQGWGRWHEDSGEKKDCNTLRYVVQPSWGSEFNTALILDGSRSQQVGNQFDTWRGGVVQDVTNLTPGTTYRFSVWGWARATNEQYPAPSDTSVNIRVRVGIDPTGGGNWSSPSIVWGNAVSPHDNWQQAVVETAATGNKISVFVEADFSGPNQCRAHLDSWFDKAELIAVNAAPAPTNTPVPQPAAPQPPAPQPTAVPPTAVPEPTAEPTATTEPSPTPIPPTETPAGGSICVNAFGDNNGNGLNDPTEGYMAGVRFVVAQGNTLMGEGVSSGTPDPVCFDGLPVGPYQVGVTLPNTLEPTTATNITVNASQGQTLGLEFGTRVRGSQPPATEIAQGGDTGDTTGVDDPATSPTDETETGATDDDATSSESGGLPTWAIVAIVVGGIAFLALFGLIIYLITLLRKQ